MPITNNDFLIFFSGEQEETLIDRLKLYVGDHVNYICDKMETFSCIIDTTLVNRMYTYNKHESFEDQFNQLLEEIEIDENIILNNPALHVDDPQVDFNDDDLPSLHSVEQNDDATAQHDIILEGNENINKFFILSIKRLIHFSSQFLGMTI